MIPGFTEAAYDVWNFIRGNKNTDDKQCNTQSASPETDINRRKDAKANTEHIYAKIKRFALTIRAINEHSAYDGSFESSGPLKSLLTEMKAFGIANANPDKKKYTKEEARKLTDEMQRAFSNLDTDFRASVQKVEA